MGQPSAQQQPLQDVNHSNFDPLSFNGQNPQPVVDHSNFDPLGFTQFPPQSTGQSSFETIPPTRYYQQPVDQPQSSSFLPSSFSQPPPSTQNDIGLFSSSQAYPQEKPIEALKHTADSLSQDIEILQDRLHDISDTIGIN